MRKPFIKVLCEHGEVVREIATGEFVQSKNAAWNRRTINVKFGKLMGAVTKIVFMDGEDKALQILTPASEGVEVTKGGIKIVTGTLMIKWVGDRRD